MLSSLMATTIEALVTSGCDAKLWNAAVAAEASLTVAKDFTVCVKLNRYSATVSGAASRNGRSWLAQNFLKYSHAGVHNGVPHRGAGCLCTIQGSRQQLHELLNFCMLVASELLGMRPQDGHDICRKTAVS